MALQVLTDEFARTRDPDKIKELTHLTQDQADRIRTVAEQLGDQHEEEWAERQAEAQAGGGGRRGAVEVALTEGQVARVEALTGERVESVVLADPRGVLTRSMATLRLAEVELAAVSEVIRRRRAADADGMAERLQAAGEAHIEAVRAATESA